MIKEAEALKFHIRIAHANKKLSSVKVVIERALQRLMLENKLTKEESTDVSQYLKERLQS